jgi:hypothetical protein
MKAIPTVAQKSLLTALLLTLLSACTVYYGSPLEPATRAVITRFVPDRGEGAVYRRGQAISFTLSSQRDGYLSLLVIDPDGSRYAIARNLPVRAGSNRLSGPTRTTRFAVVPPAGPHRVRAYFSDLPLPGHGAGFGFDVERDLARYAFAGAETSFVLSLR